MNEYNTQNIATVIQRFLKENRLDTKMDVTSVQTDWRQIAGELVANHTKRLFFKETTLFLEVDSSELKNELHFLKEAIIRNVNLYMKKEFVTQIVLI
ncbi:MAG: DUF721 domain-containing protein [Bacteroidetes bacterium]|nr:DUF721 domain-containing protein [Bacteroidota bacterium]